MSDALTEGGICSRCHEHTGFELIEGEVVSECCGWPEWDPSNYADQGDS